MEPQNPTAGDSGASTPSDPIDRIQAYLDAQGGDSTQEDNDPAQSASKPTEDPKEGDQGKTNEPQFTTEHLATFLGIDPEMVDVDEEGQPVFKAKVDGKEQAAKFKDFLSDYQKRGAAENRMREAADREKAADRKMQEAEQAIQAKLGEQQHSIQQVGQLAAILQQELQGEAQRYNWDELWRSDPAQARGLERHFAERQQRINAVMQQVALRGQAAMKQAEEAKEATKKKAEETQQKRVYELIPEWRDRDVMTKEAGDMERWMQKSGFDAGELDMSKASSLALLRRAWQHDTLQASKPQIEKKLREAPKLVKPGTPTPQGESNAVQLKALKQQARTTGRNSTKAVEAYLLASGKA